MAAIVYQTDKRSGITYAYESVSFWDKEKQQSRAKRTLIGKLDPETGEIVPTRKKKESLQKHSRSVSGPVPAVEVQRKFFGATYLLDGIGEKLGITADLKHCFPERYRQLLSIAYYLILEDSSPLLRFPKWARLHQHPYGHVIPSQRSSELFASITEDERYRFFLLQAKRRAENEFWCYDTTSISSYSEQLTQVRYGKNKEGDALAQINLALLFGENSNLPFYYRKLPGNITDVTTVKQLLEDMAFLEHKRVKLVMDRGFYSAANVNALFKDHRKFLMATKTSLSFVARELEKAREDLRSWRNYSSQFEVYACSRTIQWDYTQERSYKQDILKGKRKLYLHLYYNSERAVDEEKRFHTQLAALEEELRSGRRRPDHKELYATYFNVTSTPVRGLKIQANDEAIEERKRRYGYFVLISNVLKDPIEALCIYRNKDLSEKAFGNLKERLNLRRLLVSSDASLDGKLFVQFLALIYLSYIKKCMQDEGLFSNYTINGLLDDLDVIECYQYPGSQLRTSEVTTKQKELYDKLGIAPPTSLQ